MSAEGANLFERVRGTYQQLAGVATTLNASSDKLGSSITSLDNALRKLKLGIESWSTFRSGREHPVLQVWHDDIGFAKIGGRWGLAIRQVVPTSDDEAPEIEQWPFNDAPRMLRVKAVDHIPDLFERLLKDAKEAVEKVNRQAQSVDIVTAALNDTPDTQDAASTPPGDDGKGTPSVSLLHRKLKVALMNQKKDQTATLETPLLPPDGSRIDAPVTMPRSAPRPGRNNA